MAKKLVIVESPTKAKTIKKFLGKDYVVESCMGHIRDLPKSAKDVPEKFKKFKWSRLGVDVENDFEPLYCVPNDKKKIVNSLKDKLEDVSELYLATDEDREGESISWHLLEVLKPKVPVKRMVFHEITEDAIKDSLKKTRKIDDNLVRAQEARRILDRLVGFSLSPLIWKKVAYGLSAGRVQSVALRLLCERELSRFKFKKAVYCGLEATLEKSKDQFVSRLVQHDGKKIATGKDFDQETGEIPKEKKSQFLVLDPKQTQKIQDSLKNQKLKVESVDERPLSREPYAPFITSTLQQDASRKFGWASRQTMRVAQELYEKGFITYMRTDSVNLSEQALGAARDSVKKLFGEKFLSKEPRTFKGKKVKGAQEAHEAIRPAGAKFLTPEEIGLSGDPLKLYDLIWKRTLASQMANSQQRQIQVRLLADKSLFAASGTIIEFPGFLKVYEEATDDQEDELTLPELKTGEMISIHNLKMTEHETKPPSRLTEAGLIQIMEKEGIGRPSTYASTIGTIVDRGYVQKQGNTLIPTFTALVVSKLLSKHFPQYVDLKFTAEMEEHLDEIAEGNLDWIKYLKSIFLGKEGLRSQVEKQDKIIDADEARSLKVPGLEKLSFRVGRYGAYVCRMNGKKEECASLPESRAPSEVTEQLVNELIDQKINGADSLGKDPATGRPIYVLNGRYGPYVQLGDNEDETEDGENKPKRTSIPAHMLPDTIDMEKATMLLSLPKKLGVDPNTKKDIKLGIGRFGPYVVCDGDYRSVPKAENFFDVDLKKALELFAQPKKGRGARASALKVLGKHPSDQTDIQLMNGKYGPYIKWGKNNVSLPEGSKPEEVTLEQALTLLSAKTNGKSGAKKAKKIGGKPAGKFITKPDLKVSKVIAKKPQPKEKSKR